MISRRDQTSDGVQVAVTSQQVHTPPPEQSSTKWTRRVILAAFWAVIVALGLPHWVWTTSIHRSNLPLETMKSWAEGKSCQLRYPIHIQLRSSVQDDADLPNLATQIEAELNAKKSLPMYGFHVTTDTPGSNLSSSLAGEDHFSPNALDRAENALTVILEGDTKAKSTSAALRSWAPILDIRHNPQRSVNAVTLAPFITEEIQKIFTDEQNTLSYLLDGSPFASSPNTELLPETKSKLDSQNTRAFKYASTYHLTFSLFTPGASPSAWDIEEAIRQYLQPLLDRLSGISHLTVDTQVQLYASFSPSITGPVYDSSTGEWKLQKTDLGGFINAAEWPLSPGIGSGPTINFVLYVPSKEFGPLVIAETGGDSWLIPQWGGVQILNPKSTQDKLGLEDLQPVMLTFADQLTSLLGLPQSPASLTLRISSLTRERATSLMMSASSTLGALARLTDKLTSIAIPDSVAKSVDETISRLDQTCVDLRAGRFHSALQNGRVAETEAETAFFEPSMVGQVYFPDEHKVAVYVPLLGPMAVPLVMAGLKELKKLRDRKSKVA